MELEFSLSKEDILTGALFLVSQTSITKKRKFREQYIYPVIYCIMMGVLFYINNFFNGIIISVLMTILWMSLYPFLLKFLIRKNINKQKKNTEKARVTIKITNDYLDVVDQSGESKIKMPDINRIIEIKDYFLIGIKQTGHLTIPKNQIDTIILNAFIKKISELSNIELTDMMNWKWK